MENVFPYPGGKSYLSKWIIGHFPHHNCYVEMFGGGASVLVNKPPSANEIYNDVDGDLVQFFRVMRDRGDELEAWLRQVPYSREQHQSFKEVFYNGERPDDEIERAGRFFYLRNTQYAGKYRTSSGFCSGQQRNNARRFRNNTAALAGYRERFADVVIENLDYAKLVELYDDESTLFYADPPYVEQGDTLYRHGEFDQERFCETVTDIDGQFCISYQDIPEPLQSDTEIRTKDAAQHMNKGHKERTESAEERLVMNFDPDSVPAFSAPEQSRLPGVATGGGRE